MLQQPQRYLLLGAGGTGSHFLAPALRYLTQFHKGSDPGVWQFGIMDGDAYEEKNLDRQLFDPAQVQMNKAKAAAEAFAYMGNVVPIPEYLGKENIPIFVQDNTVIFIAVDNFPVRSLIEQYARTLQNLVVINAGNEVHTGSVQIWVRKDGKDQTPHISFLHPELNEPGVDRALLTCAEAAALPGGEQLIVANAMAATYMLTALIAYHQGKNDWTEVQFDLLAGNAVGMNQRERRGWDGWVPEPDEAPGPVAYIDPELPIPAIPGEGLALADQAMAN